MSKMKQFKLTKYTNSGGWGSKFSIEDLGQILSLFNLENKNPNILIDSSDKDDAAVYKLNDGKCLVLTVDFFPPNVRLLLLHNILCSFAVPKLIGWIIRG